MEFIRAEYAFEKVATHSCDFSRELEATYVMQ